MHLLLSKPSVHLLHVLDGCLLAIPLVNKQKMFNAKSHKEAKQTHAVTLRYQTRARATEVSPKAAIQVLVITVCY